MFAAHGATTKDGPAKEESETLRLEDNIGLRRTPITSSGIVRLGGGGAIRQFLRHTLRMRTSVSPTIVIAFPAEIISHCVWLYFRFALSFRDVEEMLAMRGVSLSYETVREWCFEFGQPYSNRLRRKSPQPGDRWHLDEVFLKINGHIHYLSGIQYICSDGTQVKRPHLSRILSVGIQDRPEGMTRVSQFHWNLRSRRVRSNYFRCTMLPRA